MVLVWFDSLCVTVGAYKFLEIPPISLLGLTRNFEDHMSRKVCVGPKYRALVSLVGFMDAVLWTLDSDLLLG